MNWTRAKNLAHIISLLNQEGHDAKCTLRAEDVDRLAVVTCTCYFRDTHYALTKMFEMTGVPAASRKIADD